MILAGRWRGSGDWNRWISGFHPPSSPKKYRKGSTDWVKQSEPIFFLPILVGICAQRWSNTRKVEVETVELTNFWWHQALLRGIQNKVQQRRFEGEAEKGQKAFGMFDVYMGYVIYDWYIVHTYVCIFTYTCISTTDIMIYWQVSLIYICQL